MAIVEMESNAVHISEFAPSTWGEKCNGTCTFAAAAMALASAQGHPTTQQGVIDLMLSMKDASFKRGECAANGAATISAVAKELRNRGADIAIEWDYQGDHLPEDWHSLIQANAGKKPIVLQFAAAYNLYDVAGVHEDMNVHYHAGHLAGKATNGYVFGDPNNPTIMQTFDIYPYALDDGSGHLFGLAPASPCGLIMLNPQTTPAPSGGVSVTLPTGWHDDGTILTAPNGVAVIHGFRAYCLAHPEFLTLAGNPIAAEYNVDALGGDAQRGPGTEQLFTNAALGYTRNKDYIAPLWIGAMYVTLASALQKAQSDLQAASTQIQQQAAEIAQLQAAQPTPAPTPSPLGDQLIALIRQVVKGGNQ